MYWLRPHTPQRVLHFPDLRQAALIAAASPSSVGVPHRSTSRRLSPATRGYHMKAGSTDHVRYERKSENVAHNHPFPTPAFFRIADVLRITALSRPTLYRRMAAGRFPLPIHLGGRACAWTPAALQTWINDPDGYRAPQTASTSTSARRGPGRPRKYTAYGT